MNQHDTEEIPMSRTLLFSLLTIVMLLLGGCGNDAETKSPVTFSAFLPLTGDLSFLGDPGRYALQIAEKRINDTGGVLGRPLKVKFEDTKGSPATAGFLFTRMPENPDNRSFLTTLSGVSLEIARKTRETSSPTLQFVLAIHPDIVRSEYDNVRLCYNAMDEASALVNAIRTLQTASLTSLISIDAVSASEYENHILPALDSSNIKINEIRFKVGESDFRPLARRVASQKPAVILALGYGSDFMPLIEALREYSELANTTIVGGIGFVEIPTYVDTRMYRNIYFVGPAYLADIGTDKSSEFHEFVQAYRDKAGGEKFPPYDAIYTYDSLMLWRDTAGKISSLDPQKIMANIRQLTNYKGILGDVPMKDGDAHPPVALLQFSSTSLINRFVPAKIDPVATMEN